MKKTTAFFLTIGVVAMLVGGIGSVFYFHRAEKSAVKNTHETYPIKNPNAIKEARINLSGNTHVNIQTDAIDHVTMDTHRQSINLKSSLKVKENDHRLIIDMAANQQEKVTKEISFGFFDHFYSNVIITIPDNIDKLVIEGDTKGTVSISKMNTEELSLDLKNSTVHFSNITTETLSSTSQNGNISLSDNVHTAVASFKTKNGNITLVDFSVDNLSAVSENGDVFLTRTNGAATIETTNGDISLVDVKGEVTAKSNNGSIRLQGNDLPKKLNVSSKQGDISLSTNEILYDVSITGKSKLGDISIFDKKRTNYHQGNASRIFDLETTFGNITVDGPYEHQKDEN